MKALVSMAALVVCVSIATASVTPTLGLGQPVPSPFSAGPECQAATAGVGNCWLYTYELGLSANAKLDPTQTELPLLVLYDFGGFTGFQISLSNFWTLAGTPLSGPLGTGGGDLQAPYAWFPLAADPGDDPTIPNLVFQYTGPVQTGPDPLFDFLSIESRYGPALDLSFFRGQGSNVSPGNPSHNTAFQTSSGIEVPAIPRDDNGIPEPGTMALLGSALLVATVLRKRKRV